MMLLVRIRCRGKFGNESTNKCHQGKQEMDPKGMLGMIKNIIQLMPLLFRKPKMKEEVACSL